MFCRLAIVYSICCCCCCQFIYVFIQRTITYTTYSTNILLTFTLEWYLLLTLLILSSHTMYAFTTYITYITIKLTLNYAKLLPTFQPLPTQQKQ